jgi:hypothetical protein
VPACSGDSVQFTVAANGTSPLSYRWRKNTVPLSDGGNISGAASDTLTINPVGSGDNGSYDALVTNICGTATSGAANLNFSAPPQITCPDNITTNAEPGQCSAVVVFAPNASGTPTPTVACSPPSGTAFPVGTTTVTCTATDSFGTSTASFLVIVQDISIPTLILPADIVTANPTVTYSVTATDTIDPSPDVHCSPVSGATFPFGLTTVQCFAVDNGGNFAFGSFHVTVTGGPPQLIVPDDIEVEATAALTPVSYTVQVFDATSSSCSPASGSGFPLGTTTVTCTATNNVGTSSASFNVTVLDRTPPDLILADITAEATSAAGATVPYVVTATDLVDGSVTPSCTPMSGSQFPLGSTTVQCTATDAHGNTAEGSFTVTVQDTTPPEITSLSVNPSGLWPPDHKMIPVTVTAVAIDAVDPNPLVHIVSVTSNQPINGTGDGDVGSGRPITR